MNSPSLALVVQVMAIKAFNSGRHKDIDITVATGISQSNLYGFRKSGKGIGTEKLQRLYEHLAGVPLLPASQSQEHIIKYIENMLNQYGIRPVDIKP